jgi:hypothetical protein
MVALGKGGEGPDFLFLMSSVWLASLQPVRLAMTRQSDRKESGHYSVDDRVLVPGYISGSQLMFKQFRPVNASKLLLVHLFDSTSRFSIPTSSAGGLCHPTRKLTTTFGPPAVT